MREEYPNSFGKAVYIFRNWAIELFELLWLDLEVSWPLCIVSLRSFVVVVQTLSYVQLF